MFLSHEHLEGGVDNIPRITFKNSEQEAGSPLIGNVIKVSDGYFLLGLSPAPYDEAQNLQLMSNRNWIDIPAAYKARTRILLSFPKGAVGNLLFNSLFSE